MQNMQCKFARGSRREDAGRSLSFIGVQNVRHGTAWVDGNKYVHFQPETNYFGSGADFDYSVNAPNGQTYAVNDSDWFCEGRAA